MKKILFMLLLGISLTGVAQYVDCVSQIFYTDDGSVPGYPEGYTTYRIYAQLENDEDVLQAVIGVTNNPMIIGTTTNNIWNSTFGGAVADDINPLFFEFIPSLPYDSFLTIGKSNSQDPGADILTSEYSPGDALENAFDNTGENALISDGAWTSFNPMGVNHLPVGPNNLVFIAQITTDGEPFWKLNFQVYDTDLGAIQFVWDANNVDPYPPFPQFWIPFTDMCYCPSGLTFGCTDSTACNFDPLASCSSMSCTYPGCNDPLACNYYSFAACDNGTCVYGPSGCMDTDYCNYDPAASWDDGSCSGTPGCLDILACNYSSSYACPDNSTCFYDNFLSGYVFQDVNENAFYDPPYSIEHGLFGWEVSIPALGISVFTDSNGYYSFTDLPPGDHDVEIVNQVGWTVTTALPQTIALNNCADVSLNFGTNTDDYQPFFIWGLASFNSASINCTSGMANQIYILNQGSEPLYGQVSLLFDTTLEVGSTWSNLIPVEMNPGELVWNLNGLLQSGWLSAFTIQFNGPGVEYVNESFDITLNIQFEDDQGNPYYTNSWNSSALVVCGYDPNDKNADNPGYSDQHFILSDDELVYRIRFQNTGNYWAENISIKDTIDTDVLDMSTFEPLYGSHNFMTTVGGNGELDFVFDDIFLPDSTTNEPESHGFVVYRIKPFVDLEAGTVINNTAHIFFDDNPAVITNTTLHTIYECTNELAGFSVSAEEICVGQELLVENSQDYVESYEWFLDEEAVGTDSGVQLIFDEPGTYSIHHLANNPLCSAENVSTIVVHPLPNTQIVQNGNVLNVAEAASFQWFLNATIINGANTSSLTVTEDGTYSVLVENEFGCSAMSDDFMVTIDSVDEQEVSVMLYPNPAEEQVTLRSSIPLQHVRIFDSSGRVVLDQALNASTLVNLDIRELDAGNYHVQVTGSQATIRRLDLVVQ
jgi:uncharacterized repeat protein (TIGR01451 family)